MEVQQLDLSPSVLHQFVNELRDKDYQHHKPLFRKNLERIGELLAYELSKDLNYKATTIKTVLGTKSSLTLEAQPVIVSILRAGLALHQGLLNYFDHANHGFISANRVKHQQDISIELGYKSLPNINQKTLVLADPMLATGHSMVECLKLLLDHYSPSFIHIVVVVAAPEGIAYLNDQLKHVPVKLWVASCDQKLDKNAYIVPGLGDAGDLAYGIKE